MTEPGDYAIRGGIIDIYPPGEGGPVRLDLFGDVLDGARRFDPATQRTTEKLTVVELAPVSEVILDDASITRFRQNYRIEFGAAGSDDPLYEAVSAGRKHAGMEHWLPFFHEKLETLFDYLPGVAVMLDDQITPARLSRWEGIADQYDTRLEAMKRKDRLDSVYKPAAPGIALSRRCRMGCSTCRASGHPACRTAASNGAGGSGCGRAVSGATSRRSGSWRMSIFSARWPII